MINIWEKFLAWWDFKVYCWSYNSLNRMMKRNPGMAYLFELNIREYRKHNPISKELEKATEEFFNEII